MTPGRKFSTTTSLSRMIALAARRPSWLFRSSTTERLLRLIEAKFSL